MGGEGAGQLEPGTDLKANEVNQSNIEALGAEMNLSQWSPCPKQLTCLKGKMPPKMLRIDAFILAFYSLSLSLLFPLLCCSIP